jgi:hypothetical protein
MNDAPSSASSEPVGPSSPHGDPARGPSASDVSSTASSRQSFDDDPYADRFGGEDTFSGAYFALELGKEWVRQNQTTAMIGAFAAGAFIGALMRD